jgi:hypothetical protein
VGGFSFFFISFFVHNFRPAIRCRAQRFRNSVRDVRFAAHPSTFDFDSNTISSTFNFDFD